jgi:hypothetical protein
LFVQRNDAPSIRAQSHGAVVAVDVDRGNTVASRSAPAICLLHRKRFARERIEHAPMIARATEIRCFMILETSDAREASNVTRKFSIRTRRFYSRDDFFI